MPAKGSFKQLNKQKPASSGPKKTVEHYLEKIGEFIEQLDFDGALNLARIGLSPDKGHPNNIQLLERMGEIYMELGEAENAKQAFSKAAKVEPTTGYLKFFNLGQLHQGNTSVTYFNRGIEILKKNPNDSGMSTQDAARAMSDAFCSIAEIYMTDLCDLPAAEIECANSVENAKKADPTNFHAFITSASCRISQQDNDAAKADAKAAFDLIVNTTNDSEEELGLGFTRKLNGARIFIELELVKEAEETLLFLKKEMKESADIYYLLGVCSKLQDFYEDAARYFEKALKIFDSTEGQRDAKEERDEEFRKEIVTEGKEMEKLLKSGKGKQRPEEAENDADMEPEDKLDDKDYEDDIPEEQEEDVDMEK